MSWAHYLLQVNIYLVVFYGFYKLLLDKETYFTLNRIYLVSSGLLSLFIPFLRFEWFTKQAVTTPVYVSVSQINYFVERAVAPEQESSGFSIGNFIVLIYLIGVLVFFSKLSYQLFKVQILLKKKQNGMAFSFFRKKIVDKALPQEATINNHEDVHVRQFHSADVLFFELLAVFTWFNPIIYAYKYAIKNIHEYLADEVAASFQGDKEAYSLLLLSSAFGVVPSTLTNSFFNKSLIKKRIFMLHKQRSRKTAILKYGMALPLFAIMLVMSSATIRNNEKIQDIANEIPLEQPLTAVKEVVLEAIAKPGIKQKSSALTEVLDPDWKNFYQYIKKTLRYPEAARKAKLQGNSQIKFTLKNGEVAGIGVVAKSLGLGCDAEVMKKVLSYSEFKSIPDGKYIFNTVFKLNDSKEPLKEQKLTTIPGYTTLNKMVIAGSAEDAAFLMTAVMQPVIIEELVSTDKQVYDYVSIQKSPDFPGGMVKFQEFLNKAIRYPKEAYDNKVEGKVFVSFVVEQDGSLSNINVDRKLGSGTDEEAVRVLKNSPKWIPGIQDGKPVRVKFNIPINFKLSSAKTEIDFNELDRIREQLTNPPIYILDGERIDDIKFRALDASTIESISILKDTSAIQLYGPEGKNGVIIVTTKKVKVKENEQADIVISFPATH